MADRCVIGIDGGGTKTDACVVTESGAVVGFGSGSGANWEGVGLEQMRDTLDRAISIALGSAGVRREDIAATAFCLAGVDWPADPPLLAPFLDQLGLGGERVVTNDSFAALRAGCRDEHGVVSIAGTGAVCAGRNRAGVTKRSMGIGWGESTGSWGIVEAALHAIARAHHTRSEPTSLTEHFMAALGLEDPLEMFEQVSRQLKFPGAEYAPLVLAAAREGDTVARGIATDAGHGHAQDVIGLARRLEMEDDSFDLVVAGGVHLAGDESFAGAFEATVAERIPRARIRPLDTPPAAGAALLAWSSLAVDATTMSNRVCKEARAAKGPE